MANPALAPGALQKKPRGSHILEREADRKELADQEWENKQAAKARDGWKCRWPEAHKCRGGLEACHVEAKGMGSDHGTRSNTGNLIAFCAWIHRRGPVTLEHHGLRVEFETPAGCDGPVSFWREDGGQDPVTRLRTYVCVGRERLIGLLERD